MFGKKTVCKYCGTKLPADSTYCTFCGHVVDNARSSNFCPRCGQPVESGVRVCCHCGTRLAAVSRNVTAENSSKELGGNRQWMRIPGDIAQRFDIQDIKGFFSKKITVEQGTKAIFLQGGRYCGTLPAGVYDFGDIRSGLLNLNLEERAVVILIETGEIALSFSIQEGELQTRDHISIGAACMLTLRLEQPLEFLENYFKSGQHISSYDLEREIYPDVLSLFQQTVLQFSVEDLVGNQELSNILNQKFTATFIPKMLRKGFTVLSIHNISFTPGAYSEVYNVQRAGKIAADKARTDFATQSALRNFKNVDLIDDIEGSLAVQTAEQRKSHELIGRENDFWREQNNLDTCQGLEILQEIRDIQNRQTAVTLAQKEHELAILRENERVILENRSNASTEALLSILEKNNNSTEIAQLELAKRAVSLSPEQILAIQAGKSDAAAQALSLQYRAAEQKEFNQRTESICRESADRQERILDTALNMMGQTATAKSTAYTPAGTTIVSGGLGSSVVVDGSNSPQMMKICQNCKTNVPINARYCPACGKEV